MTSFKFWETYIFYIYLLKSAIIIYSIRKGIKEDKVDRPIYEEKERIKKQEKEIQKKLKEEK